MKHSLLLILLSALLIACNAGEPTTPPPPTATPAPSATPVPASATLPPTAILSPTETASPVTPPPASTSTTANLEVIAHVEGDARAVVAEGEYAYVADSAGSLRVLDFSDRANPTQMSVHQTSGLPEGLSVAGDYVYVADGYAYGLRIFDISDPTNPVEVGFFATPGPAFDAAVDGSRAYLAEGYQPTAGELTGGGLRIIDISDPAAPVEVGFYDTPGQALSVALAEPYAYVGDSEAGLRVIDVSSPDAPAEVGAHDTRGPVSAIEAHGGLVYLIDGWGGSLRIIDTENPATLTEAGFYYTFGLAQDVAVLKDRAFIVDSDGQFHALDVSARSAPTEAAFGKISGTAADVAMAGDYVYVAAGNEGLFVLTLDSPHLTPTPAPPTPALPAETPPSDLHRPARTFAELWTSDELLRRALGWAQAPEPAEVTSAFQPFEGGVMIWREDKRLIYALFRDGSWRAFEDTWTEDQPEFNPNIVPPEGRFQPIRGFGKVWRTHREVRGRLGWALRSERGHTALIQTFQRGELVGIGDAIYALIEVAGRLGAWHRPS